jgi:hypothetical protein
MNNRELQKELTPEKPLPQIAVRWLQLGPQAFIDEQLESARAEQQGIKDRIRTSIANYFRIITAHKSP